MLRPVCNQLSKGAAKVQLKLGSNLALRFICASVSGFQAGTSLAFAMCHTSTALVDSLEEEGSGDAKSIFSPYMGWQLDRSHW